jgi:membrane associated rhomboid family serine protease
MKGEEKMKSKKFTIVFFSIIVFMVLPTMAFGYIDPGTGSYLLQIVIATLMGSLLALKIFWQKIKGFFVNIAGKKQK